jgi:hypothetical protein
MKPTTPEGLATDESTAAPDTAIRYSRGAHTFDSYPVQHIAATFSDFAAKVIADRSLKKGHAYVCGPCCGHRTLVFAPSGSQCDPGDAAHRLAVGGART